MANMTALEQEVERNYKHNFIVNVMDGTFFWFGFTLISPTIILPVYISHFTHNTFLIGLIPAIANFGFLIPQLFTSNWVQRLPRKKIMVINVGLFSERLPIMLMAPTALLLVKDYPVAALIVFFALFTWHEVGAGFIMVAWQEMLAKVFPTDRRGRFFGLANFGGTASGVVGALMVAWLLDRFAFPTGYIVTFAIAGAFIFLSWTCLAQTREPVVHNTQPVVSFSEYFHSLPAIFKKDVNFRRFISAQSVVNMSGMAAGFIVVYATLRWKLPDSQAGDFAMAMLVGQALANLAFGWLSDRRGHKLVIELSALVGMFSFVLAAFAPAPVWFYVVFFLRGVAVAGLNLSVTMLPLEFCAPEIRPTYIGLTSTITGVVSGIAPMLGSLLAGGLGYPLMFIISGVIGLAGFISMRWMVREPRFIRAGQGLAAEAETPRN
jgi:MFS family permease